MRLNVRKINDYSYYTIIKDYTNLSGKRTTKIFEKLGNQQQVEERFGKTNTLDKIKEYINNLNNEDKEELLKKEFNPNKRISGGIKRQFNVGYLFLEKIYNQLNIKNICNDISNKYQFHFDLNEILSYLVYARIIYPSSKLETFKQCQNFIEQPKFKLHDEYRALSYIANNMDYIQEQLYNNSKKVINRNSSVIYYDCTNYFFEIETDDDLRKYGISKQHQPSPLVGMGLFMDGDGLPLSCNIYPGNMNEQKTLIPEESKIVNNFKCNIACLLDSEEANNCEVGKSIKLRLQDSKEISAKIIKKDEQASGKQLIVFEVTNSVVDLIKYRKISFDVIWWSYSGLKIPNSAIKYEGDFAYVIRNRAGLKEKIVVKVLKSNNKYSIVENYTYNELKEAGYDMSSLSNKKNISVFDQIEN